MTLKLYKPLEKSKKTAGRAMPVRQNHHELSSRFCSRAVQRRSVPTHRAASEFKHVDATALRPSFVSTLHSVCGSLVKPAIGVVLFAGLFITVAASPDNTLQQQDAERIAADEAAKEQIAVLNAQRSQLFETASLSADSIREAPEELRNKVSFIAGLIAVHRPSLRNSGEIARYIVELSATEKVSPFYIAAIISVESRFGAGERSPVGAMGLMQLMPNTAKYVSAQTTGSRSYPTLTDPKTNIRLGIEYIKELEQRYKGNRTLALAAYNWGPANIDRVKAGRARIPASVNRYASTVLERFLRWQAHYKNAERHSESMEADLVG